MSAATFLGFLALLAAVNYWRRVGDAPGTLRSVEKTAATALLALVALLAGGPWLLAAGLALSAVGDFALSRKGEAAFQTGLAGFAVAHIAYAALFRTLPGALDRAEMTALHWGLAGALTALTFSTVFWLLPRVGGLRRPVAVYVVLITVMGFAAILLPPAFLWVTVGAALFILSDLILALEMFVLSAGDPRKPLAARLVWPLYWAGQALICWGVLAGLGLI